jgi:hypothetical protein
MKSVKIFFTLIFLATYTNNLIAASDKDIKDAEDLTQYIVTTIRDKIQKSSIASLKEANLNTNVVIDDFVLPNAAISHQVSSNKYTVHFSNRLALAILYNYEMLDITMANDYKTCYIEYANYINKISIDNIKKLDTKQPLAELLSPEEFSFICSACKDIDKYLPIKDSARERRDYSLDISLLMIYLHELGHKYLNHNLPDDTKFLQAKSENEKKEAFLEYMNLSRNLEIEADNWAIDQAILLNVPYQDILGCQVYSFLIATSGIDCTVENVSSHPLGLSRISNAVDRIHYNISLHNLITNNEITVLMNDIVKFNKKVWEQFTCK